MPKAVIAGGGPVGAITAIFLAQQGYTVDVFEKRARPQSIPPPSDSRAYLLNLNFRAFAALKEAGVSAETLLKRCNGRSEFIFRDAKGRKVAGVNLPVTPDDPTMIRVYRDEISRHLMDEGHRLHPEAIKYHFEAAVAEVDLDKRVVSIKGPKTQQEMQYDLLVGADGGGSAVRSELQKAMPSDFLRRKTNAAVYATGPLKVKDKNEYPGHTFTTMDSFEAGAVMVYGRGNGDYRVGLFLDKAGSQRLKEGDDEWLQQYLDSTMPDLLDDARQSVKHLAANPPDFSAVSGWTYLSQFHGPHVVLLGDAAHTMTPVLGQGCNSGLEDALIFSRILRAEKDLDAALPAYTAARLPDIKALIRLNEIVAGGRFRAAVSAQKGADAAWHKLWLVANNLALSTQMARMSLHRAAPTVFPMPPMYKSLTGVAPFRKVFPAAYTDLASIVLIGGIVAGALHYSFRRN